MKGRLASLDHRTGDQHQPPGTAPVPVRAAPPSLTRTPECRDCSATGSTTAAAIINKALLRTTLCSASARPWQQKGERQGQPDLCKVASHNSHPTTSSYLGAGTGPQHSRASTRVLDLDAAGQDPETLGHFLIADLPVGSTGPRCNQRRPAAPPEAACVPGPALALTWETRRGEPCGCAASGSHRWCRW